MVRRNVIVCATLLAGSLLLLGGQAIADRGHCRQRTGTCDPDCEKMYDAGADVTYCEWAVNLTYLKCTSSEQCEDCDNEYTNPSENWIYECRIYQKEIDPWENCNGENCSGGFWDRWGGDQIPNACSDCN